MSNLLMFQRLLLVAHAQRGQPLLGAHARLHELHSQHLTQVSQKQRLHILHVGAAVGRRARWLQQARDARDGRVVDAARHDVLEVRQVRVDLRRQRWRRTRLGRAFFCRAAARRSFRHRGAHGGCESVARCGGNDDGACHGRTIRDGSGPAGRRETHVEREAVHRDPARDAHAERANLGAAHPHARAARDALALEAERAERADHALLQCAHVPVQVLPVGAQVEHGVDDELPRAVVRDLAAALRAEDVKRRMVAPQVGERAARTERQHGRVLHHEQRVGRRRHAAAGARRLDALGVQRALPGERRGVRHLPVPQVVQVHLPRLRARVEWLPGRMESGETERQHISPTGRRPLSDRIDT
eukprot:4814640-Prymnesium_polylepis.1